MTDAHAGPSLSSVVMSLKRMPSVGKSLMSRIFARSASTSMAAGILPAGLRRRNAKNLLGERREVVDEEIGVRRCGAEAAGVVRGAHADRVRPDHVRVGVVADVHRDVRRHPGAGQRDAEDLGVWLAEADLV